MLKRSSDLYLGGYGRVAEEAESAAGPSLLDPRELWKIALRRLPVIAGIALLGTLIAAIHAFQITPRYTAQALILIDPRKTKVVESEAVLSGIGTDWAAIESEVELVRSNAVARRVVDKLGLASTQTVAGPPSVVQRVVDSVSVSGPEASPLVDDDELSAQARAVRGGLSVARRGHTYLIGVSYTHTSPRFAARAANAFAEAYLVDQLEAKFDATRRANTWLNDRIEDLGARVRQSERAVELYRAEHNLVETDGKMLSDQQVVRLNEQLILARAQTAEARVKLEQLREIVENGGEASSFANQLQSQIISQLRSKLSDVRRQMAELGSRYGARHPAVINVRAQMSDIERQMTVEVDRILASAENAYSVARSRERSIEASLNELKGEAAQTSQAEIRLRELQREAAANRALFEAFLARFKETSEQESLQTADSRIIERASVPGAPSEPNRQRIILLGLLLSLGAGAGMALLLERLDNGFRTGRQAEDVTGAPLLASVPLVKDRGAGPAIASMAERLRSAIIGRLWPERRPETAAGPDGTARRVLDRPFSPFTEAIRSLRLGIRYANLDNPARVILLTSALPGEGKSTLAANLAQHAANTGEKVLMIDMDLRHPVLTAIHAPDAEDGLVELLTGEARCGDVVRVDEETGLRFIPATRSDLVTHTAEVLGSQKIRDFLAKVREIFDLVVIDSSPLLPVTDSRALVAAVDAVVLVVCWEKTSQDAVRQAMHQTFGLEEKLAGVVMNQINVSRARYYDYYKSGYYLRQYPYYYSDAKA